MLTNTKPIILCVDDETAILQSIALNLGRRFEVLTASDGHAALAVLHKKQNICVILSDMRMPGMDGATFFSMARKIQPLATRVLLTGQADLESTVRAVNAGGIFRYVTKPCPPGVLIAVVDAAFEQYRVSRMAPSASA